MKFIFRNLGRLVNIVAIIGLLIAYLSPYVDPLDFWVVSFFGLSFQVWFILNVGLFIFWIIRRSSLWKYNLIVLLLGYGFIGRNIQFNTKVDTSKNDIKVCTFNTKVQMVYSGGNTTASINEHLQAEEYDVALFVEWKNKKGNIDATKYPHQQFVKVKPSVEYGLKVVSQHPILNWERIEFKQRTLNMAAYFDIDVNGTVLRFVALHLQSNSLNDDVYERLVNVEMDKAYKEYALNFIKRLRTVFQYRSNQTKSVLEAIDESPYPVVVMGDFNDTPQSFAYQQLIKGRKDAFIERGNGWGATYLKPFPLLRIDYILHDEALVCKSYESITDVESDHALLSASFEIVE